MPTLQHFDNLAFSGWDSFALSFADSDPGAVVARESWNRMINFGFARSIKVYAAGNKTVTVF
jgi:hypothetical protein